MKIGIVSGSPDLNIKDFPIASFDIVIGVDYGAYNLCKENIRIDYAFGDFDSITSDELLKVKETCKNVFLYDEIKNDTDTEIALKFALSLNPDEISLYGVTGKRIDHFLGALSLFRKVLPLNKRLYIIDDYNRITVVSPGEYRIPKSNYQYISFFSYEDEVDLTLINFKYELTNHLLNNSDTLTISNEILYQEAIVKFTRGLLLIVESSD